MSDPVLTMLSQKDLKEILTALRRELSKLLGDQLEAIYLYGSQARGDAQPGSDIDLLIVLRGDFNYFDMIEKTSFLTAELSLNYDTVISSVFVTEEDFLHRRTPLLINIRKEGIPVTEIGALFKRERESLQAAR